MTVRNMIEVLLGCDAKEWRCGLSWRWSSVVTLAARGELGDKPWPYAEYALLAVGTVPAWGIRPYLRGLDDEG